MAYKFTATVPVEFDFEKLAQDMGNKSLREFIEEYVEGGHFDRYLCHWKRLWIKIDELGDGEDEETEAKRSKLFEELNDTITDMAMEVVFGKIMKSLFTGDYDNEE